MSILGRLAKGMASAALTGNLSAGVVAAGTNSFTLGTMFGVSDNLMNASGMMYGMNAYSPYAPSGYDVGVAMTHAGLSPYGNVGLSPYANSGCFSPNPMGHNMWTNPSITW